MFRQWALAFASVICVASGLSAQQPKPAPGPAAEKTAKLPPERIIYVPFKDLKKVYEQPDAMIVLPRQEYMNLLKQANAARETGLRKTVRAVISQAEYVATVQKDQAQINAKYTVQVFGEGWAEVPLRFGEAAVGKVTNQGGKVFLRGTANGSYALLLAEPGEHIVKLELTARVRTSPEGRSFEFNCPTVGITTFELSIPESEQTIELSPRLVALPVDAAAKETRIRAHLGSTDRIVASWNPKASLKPQMELLTRVANATRVNVADGLVHTDAQLTYSILRGELTEARIAVPLGDRILDVETPGAKVKSWSPMDKATHQEILVELLAPATGSFTVAVRTERPAAKNVGTFRPAGVDDEGHYYGIHALGVNGERGTLSIAHGNDLQLSVEQKQGIERVNANDVEQHLRQAAAFFKFYSTKFELSVLVKPLEPRVKVAQVTNVIFEDDRLKTSSVLNYTVERAGIFELRVKLPENLKLDNVRVDSMTEYDFNEQSREVKVTLAQKRTGEINLTINGLLQFDNDSGEVSLNVPVLEPLGLDQEEGTISIYAPTSLDVITDKSKVKAATAANVSSGGVIGEAKFVSQWFFNRRPVEIPVRTIRKKTRLSAEVGTTVSVEQEVVHVVTRLKYQIDNAGIATFRFAVPTSIADIIRIESPAHAIKQKVKAETSLNGWTEFTVVLQKDVLGSLTLSITYDLTPEAMQGDAVANTIIQPLRVLPPSTAANAVHISQITGEIAVSKDRALSLTPGAANDEAENVDVRELKITSHPNASLSYRYFPTSDWHDHPLTWIGIQAEDAEGGCKITGFLPSSLAERAGIKVGDVITDLGGKAIASAARFESELIAQTAERDPAAVVKIPLKLKRGDEEVSLDVTLRDSFRLTIRAEKHEVQEVVKTVVSRALVEVVLGSDPVATYLCRYRVTSSERQRLRIDLPDGAEIHSPQVNGQSASLEKSDVKSEGEYTAYFVNVSRDGNSSESFLLSLQLRRKLETQPFSGGWLGQELLPLPVVGGAGDAAVPVQHLRVLFWIPDDYSLVGDADSFELETQLPFWSLASGRNRAVSPQSLDNWMDGAGGSGANASFPRQGNAYEYSRLGGSESITVSWWDRPSTTWILSLAALLVALVLRKTSFENRLSMGLLFIFAAVMAALWDADVVRHGAAAAMYGIAAGLAWWIIRGIFGLSSIDLRGSLELISPSSWPENSPGGVAAVIPPPGVFEWLDARTKKPDDE
ncbi:MAG: PDZ domain-containing protein [Planctomycetota bacterium]|nr:PDZ domain-containing protein [Planctomycetota bacterium]